MAEVNEKPGSGTDRAAILHVRCRYRLPRMLRIIDLAQPTDFI
jgi:hypothetical protein